MILLTEREPLSWVPSWPARRGDGGEGVAAAPFCLPCLGGRALAGLPGTRWAALCATQPDGRRVGGAALRF